MNPSAAQIQRNVRAFERQLRKHMLLNARRILADRLTEEAVDASSMSDHTLKDLRDLGHPYSKRYAPNSFEHPDCLIHKQTADAGASFADSFVTKTEAHGGSVRVEVYNVAPHWRYLKDGTKTMRRRPLHEHLARVFRRELWPEFVGAMRSAFRTIRVVNR